TLPLLISRKIIDLLEDTEGEEETFYYVDDSNKMELDYYKNIIIHFFIDHSFVAISMLTSTDEVKSIESIISDYSFLKNIFKKEFVFGESEDIRGKVISVIEYFLNSCFISGSETKKGYKITKLGFDKLPIWASLTKTFLESYWIAVKAISQQRSKEGKRGDILKNMDYLGKRFHKLGVIDHIGALSQLNFKNALSFIESDIINPQQTPEDANYSAIEKLSRLSQRLYNFSHYRM
ncbi:MAG TPA: hypothetical protein VMW42_02490, partial [Desulfatiglandales bacterium]|nr:hypothetical protein [Desulfatiglandales bacterium]